MAATTTEFETPGRLRDIALFHPPGPVSHGVRARAAVGQISDRPRTFTGRGGCGRDECRCTSAHQRSVVRQRERRPFPTRRVGSDVGPHQQRRPSRYGHAPATRAQGCSGSCAQSYEGSRTDLDEAAPAYRSLRRTDRTVDLRQPRGVPVATHSNADHPVGRRPPPITKIRAPSQNPHRDNRTR